MASLSSPSSHTNPCYNPSCHSPRIPPSFRCSAMHLFPFLVLVSATLLQSEACVIRSASSELNLPAPLFTLPKGIKKIHLNIGANLTPLRPPKDDPSTAVIVVEPNIGIAHYLREEYQKKRYINRFYVINCAIAGHPLAGHFAMFHHYNKDAMSSSLSKALQPGGNLPRFANRDDFKPTEHYGPGPGGVDFVPVLSLESFLSAVPTDVKIEYLKTDTQGYDLNVIQSASRASLERVGKIMTETYLPGMARSRYEGVRNDLYRDWIPYMQQVGFALTNPPDRNGGEYDAIWVPEAGKKHDEK
eukprot:GFKZ01011899.1.p1 GENE.GFKZ01011899.1~~GFKZ01011899.1.p1  ORF type:complete len:301 (-),score=28.54 GFKZ01011899.1:287-1189(-)